MNFSIGFIKFFYERMRVWVGWAQFAIIAHLWIINANAELTIVLALLVALHLWTAIDIKWFYPKESKEGMKRNSEWAEFRADINKRFDRLEMGSFRRGL